MKNVPALARGAILALVLAPLVAPPVHAAGATAVEVHVAVDGDDTGDGSAADPVATLDRARDIVRTTVADGMDGDVTVTVHGGDYFRDDPLELDERDSGRDGHRVTWTSAAGENARVHGSREVAGTWESTAHPEIMRVQVPGVASGDWRFDQILVDDVRRTKARHPDTGYLDSAGGAGDRRTFHAAEGDLPAWDVVPGAQAQVWSSDFFTDTVPIASVDHEAGAVTLADDTLSTLGANVSYYLQGFREALDSPGEFFLDETDGYLYYWPDGEDLSEVTVTAPTVDSLVRLVGSDPQNPVRDVTVTGLELVGSRFTPYLNETHGIEWNRPADANAPALLYLRNAQDVSIRENVLSDAGFSGVTMHRSATGNEVTGNDIRDFGYHGVLLLGTASGVTDGSGEQVYDNRGNVVADNHIHHGGDLVGHGSGVFLHQSGENVVEHNVIHDLPRYGIGMKGGRPLHLSDQLTSRDNVIRYNDVSRVLQDSDDAGGITFTTVGPGNLIEANRVHDITAADNSKGSAYGLYLDNNTQHSTVRKNVVHGMDVIVPTGHHGPINAKGPYNTVTDNVFVLDTDSSAGFGMRHAQHGSNTAVDHRYLRNVVVVDSPGAPVYEFLNFADGTLAAADHNVIFDPSGDYTIRGLEGVTEFGDWLSFLGGRYDQDSILASPRFRDRAGDDYVLDPESPAFELGFQQADHSRIGTTAAAGFTAGPIERAHVSAEGDHSRADVAVGGSLDLAVTSRDAEGLLVPAGDVSLSFASADPAVATVDAGGTVTGQAVGRTAVTVTATTADGSVETTIPVFVGDEIASVELRSSATDVATGQQLSLRAVATTTLGTTRLLDPTADGVTFETGDASVASVDAEGVLTAEGVGSAGITASVAAGGSTFADEVTVTVHERIIETVHAGTADLGVLVGQSVPVEVEVLWSDGTPMDLADVDLSYTSSDPDVATVDGSGTLTAVGTGTSTVRVRATWNGIERVGMFTASGVRDTSLPQGWLQSDVGTWNVPEAYVEHDAGRWALTSNARDAWDTEDGVNLVSREIDLADYPDGVSVIATVESVREVHVQSMAGVMIRDDLTAGAVNMAPRVRPGGAMPVGLRTATDGSTVNASQNPTATFPVRMKLTYRDGTFISSYLDGEQWVESARGSATLSGTVRVGIWNAASTWSALSEAVFTDVQVVAEDPVPATAAERADLHEQVALGTAWHETSADLGSGGEYPADARSDLLAAVTAASQVLDDGDATGSAVTRATGELEDAVGTFRTARVVPEIFRFDVADEEVGSTPESVVAATPDNGTAEVTGGGYDGRRDLVLTGTSGSYVVRASVPPTEGRTRYTMRFMAEQSDVPFVLRLGAADPDLQAVHLRFLGNGTIRLRHADGSEEVNLGTYTSGTWHRVTLDLDVDTQRLDVGLDGERLIGDVPFRHEVAAVETVEWRAGAGTFWIDEVVATPAPDAEPDASAADIVLDDAALAGFDPGTTEYEVASSPGAEAPAIGAEPADPRAAVHVADAGQVPGVGSVVVISADRSTATYYELRFTCGTHTTEETIVLGGADSGVPNVARADGCTFLDLLDDAGPFEDHGAFVEATEQLADDWYEDGLLTREQRRTIVTTAARSARDRA